MLIILHQMCQNTQWIILHHISWYPAEFEKWPTTTTITLPKHLPVLLVYASILEKRKREKQFFYNSYQQHANQPFSRYSQICEVRGHLVSHFWLVRFCVFFSFFFFFFFLVNQSLQIQNISVHIFSTLPNWFNESYNIHFNQSLSSSHKVSQHNLTPS